MFNQVTLGLHIALLLLLYAFVLATVRVIAKDVSEPSPATPRPRRERQPEPSTARIVVLDGDGQRIERPVSGQITIGRAPDCDIILEEAFVSAHHARLYREQSAYWLEDLGSTNGTLFNGKKVTQPVRLITGNTFAIGSYEFTFIE